MDDAEADRMQRVVDATRTFLAANRWRNEALELLERAAARYVDDQQQTHGEDQR
jgi:hypothetical protein